MNALVVLSICIWVLSPEYSLNSFISNEIVANFSKSKYNIIYKFFPNIDCTQLSDSFSLGTLNAEI